MPTNGEVRTALAGRLEDHFGSGVAVHPVPPDTITGTSLVIGSLDWEDSTFDDGRTLNVPVWVVVSRRNTAFIEVLDSMTDNTDGVAAAIDEDPTLGGVVDSVRVISAGDYRDLVVADTNHYAATVNLEVFC